MKQIKRIIILGALLLHQAIGYAQVSDFALQHFYWNYRENFRKYFTSIGILAGEGFPFSDIEKALSADNIKVNPTTGNDLNGNVVLKED